MGQTTTEPLVAWIRTVEPAQEPVSLDEVKAALKVTYTSDDALLYSYIQAAREYAENVLGRGLLTQTWQLVLDSWWDVIWLPRAAPLQRIDSVAYYATDGTLTTLPTTVYTVDSTTRPGRFTRTAGQTWPGLQWDRQAGRIVVTYVVGWNDPALVPELIKQGLRLFVGYLEVNRDGFEVAADAARAAAEACWQDRVYWRPPERGGWHWGIPYGPGPL